MAIIIDPNVASSGLVFSIDAGNTRSYSGSGLTINGLVGGLGGTLVNGVGFTSSNSGAFSFDGSNDYVMTTAQSLSNSTYTLEVAFKIISFSSGDMRIAGAYSGSTSQLTFGFDSINTLRLWLQDTWQSSSFTASSNTFYVLNILHQSTDTYIYVNGSYNSVISGRTSSFDNLGIGNPFTMLYGSYFSGNIYSFKHYNRALSASEIKNNFEATRDRYGI